MDLIDRQAAIKTLEKGLPSEPLKSKYTEGITVGFGLAITWIEQLPAVQPERKWIPCSNPPKHHKDVIVRGIEAIGNVTVHKVMQWDVDTWRPTDYAPSVMWKEWSEI